MGKKHIGGDFDDFLREEHMLDDAEAVAAKRVIAFQICIGGWQAAQDRAVSLTFAL